MLAAYPPDEVPTLWVEPYPGAPELDAHVITGIRTTQHERSAMEERTSRVPNEDTERGSTKTRKELRDWTVLSYLNGEASTFWPIIPIGIWGAITLVSAISRSGTGRS